MLKLIGVFMKVAIFSIFILILGNTVQWDGMTISDQVRLKMSHAEEYGLVGTMRDWAEQVTHDARRGFQKKLSQPSSVKEEIHSSERQKLKALIRELNSSRKEN